MILNLRRGAATADRIRICPHPILCRAAFLYGNPSRYVKSAIPTVKEIITSYPRWVTRGSAAQLRPGILAPRGQLFGVIDPVIGIKEPSHRHETVLPHPPYKLAR